MWAESQGAAGVITHCQNKRKAGSKALDAENGLQSVIHCRGEEPKERRKEGGGGRVEMRVAAPFFTPDKNICWDINLELESSPSLLPHHPSSFWTNLHLATEAPSLPHCHPRTCTLSRPRFSCCTYGHTYRSAFCNLMQLQQSAPTGRLLIANIKQWPYRAQNAEWKCSPRPVLEVEKAGLSACHCGRLF